MTNNQNPNQYIKPIPELEELRELHSRYMRMSGENPEEPWCQYTYDRLIIGLLAHADNLLPKQKVAPQFDPPHQPPYGYYLSGKVFISYPTVNGVTNV